MCARGDFNPYKLKRFAGPKLLHGKEKKPRAKVPWQEMESLSDLDVEDTG